MSSQNLTLFSHDDEGKGTLERPPRLPATKETARVQMPNRQQLEWRAMDLESTLPQDHRARLVWAYVERLDLKALYAQIKAVKGGEGRTPIAPEILLALWLFATLEKVGSARELSRLCQQHDAYRWICGGVSVNYHTLADFRIGQGALLDELLTTSVANLVAAGLVELNRLAQDGMRIRACASSKSFRRRERLEALLAQARQQVAQLKEQVQSDPGAASRRQKAAQERAIRERQERLEAALQRLPELEALKDRQKKKGKKVTEARASTGDAEATNMKMANGGYNPAYNAQLCTDTQSQVIVGVDMVSVGADQGQMVPMLAQVQQRYGTNPEQYLVDGGYVTFAQIELGECHSTIYAPVPELRNDPYQQHELHPQDSAVIARWRQRMASDEAKEIYKQRAATAECVNALARERGLVRLRVRGRAKAKSVLLWYALAHNLMRSVALAPAMFGLTRPIPC
jgi:transposase